MAVCYTKVRMFGFLVLMSRVKSNGRSSEIGIINLAGRMKNGDGLVGQTRKQRVMDMSGGESSFSNIILNL